MQIFPIKQLDLMVVETNKQICLDNKTKVHKLTNQQELMRILGVVLLMPRLPFVPRHDLWRVESDGWYVDPPNLGQTGIARNRFDTIMRNLRYVDVLCFI